MTRFHWPSCVQSYLLRLALILCVVCIRCTTPPTHLHTHRREIFRTSFHVLRTQYTHTHTAVQGVGSRQTQQPNTRSSQTIGGQTSNGHRLTRCSSLVDRLCRPSSFCVLFFGSRCRLERSVRTRFLWANKNAGGTKSGG